MKYPIQEISYTIEGEGRRTGEAIVLIRFGLDQALRSLHLTPVPLRKTEASMLSVEEIVRACSSCATRLVHIGGEDPCLTDFQPLLTALLAENFYVMVDTFGYYPIQGYWKNDVFLSICPRPGLTVHPSAYERADEVRCYLSMSNPEVWDTLTDQVILHLKRNEQYRPGLVALMPREDTPECYHKVLQRVMEDPTLWAALPLYRIFPQIDAVAVSAL